MDEQHESHFIIRVITDSGLVLLLPVMCVARVISTDERVQTQSHINSNIYSALVCCVILSCKPVVFYVCIYTDGVKSAKEFLPLIPCRRFFKDSHVWKSRNVIYIYAQNNIYIYR